MMVPFIMPLTFNSFDDSANQNNGQSTLEHHEYHPNLDQQITTHQNFDPIHPEGSVIGNPGHEMQFWHKESFNDCDIVAQQMGLESLTAKHFSESALLHEAIQDGSHLATGGTPADYIGHLYETHGFPIERHHDATVDELKEKLAEGQKVMVAVNSEILWANGSHVSEFSALPANHSVEVIGIVYPDHDTEHPKIILNDPGIDNGQGMMVPLEQFEHAWATSHHLIAATNLSDTNTLLRDSYDDSVRGGFLLNQSSLGVPSKEDPYQFEAGVQQRAQAMRERDASLQREKEYEREHAQQLAREQQAREEETRREQLREEQRREEALHEQQQREREQQQREEQQRAEQLKEEHRREEMLREERQREEQHQREEEQARQRKEEELKAQQNRNS